MEEHKHKFKHIGGGCYQDGRKMACDDDFECECGIRFRVLTDEKGHRYLPEEWEDKSMSEVKQVEQNDQINAKIDNPLKH